MGNNGIQGQSGLAIFVDIRGFTEWSARPDHIEHAPDLIKEFTRICRKNFSFDAFKGLGDGAMLIRKIAPKLNATDRDQLMTETLAGIVQTGDQFRNAANQLEEDAGISTQGLYLGWGIDRGQIREIKDPTNQSNKDFTGSIINRAARLCGEARPFGVAVNADAFSGLDRLALDLDFNFRPQTRHLKGLGPVDVWVTDEIYSEFTPREKLRETPEVHVMGVCLKKHLDSRVEILLARRNTNRRLYPGKIECCGGQLRRNESFPEGVRRHYRQEMQLDVEVHENMIHAYKIVAPETPVIPGLRFVCTWNGGEPDSPNHSDARFYAIEEFRQMSDEEFIPGLKSDVERLVNAYLAL